MTRYAGAWGQTRNRHTQTVAPKGYGGNNAQGSTPAYSLMSTDGGGGTAASSTSQQPQAGTIKYGQSAGVPKLPALQQPGFADARWQRNVADLAASAEQNRAQTLRDLELMRARARSGQRDLGEQRGTAYETMYGQLGAGNAARSGAVAGRGGDIQMDYQRNLDELLRQFGPKQQQLTRDLYEIARKQYAAQLAAETGLAKARKQQYTLAGQTPPEFKPTVPPAYLKGSTKKPKPKKDE